MMYQQWLLRAGVGFLAFVLAVSPSRADEKEGMPDLAQVEETCLPTSAANLMIWFGHHGYPHLLMQGETEDARELRTVHQIMTDTDARFDWGTRMDAVTVGIQKYIRDAGYHGDVEYRGMDGAGPAFSADWLKQNDDPNKGFILLLGYCYVNPRTRVFTRAWNAGHAVTLVNYEPDMLLIHDPAHRDDEIGRKIVTPFVLDRGTWVDQAGTVPVAGLMLLSGSLLEGPANGTVMLTGAVRVTMHPDHAPGSNRPAPDVPNPTLAGMPSGTATAPPSAKAPTPWWVSIFDFLFEK